MKYTSPNYEISVLDALDIIMSEEPSYKIEESKDENGNKVGDITISAGSIFAQYFN